MALMRAKEECYLGPEHGGLKTPKDKPFEYTGPKHDSLVAAKGKPAPAPATAEEPAKAE